MSLDEGLLTFARIKELEESPVVGRFDTAHLCEIHRRIFQDLPHHHPGQFRREASAWVKSRELESGDCYLVPYAPRRIVEPGLSHVLIGLPGRFQGLSLDQFAARMAQLYGDLDYLHPFSEGNSRTLRTFTRQLAREAGFELDWSSSRAEGIDRDRLYQARDLAVIHRVYPDLDEQRAMQTEDRMEYETYGVLQKLQHTPSLESIIRSYTTPCLDRYNASSPRRSDEHDEEYESE